MTRRKTYISLAVSMIICVFLFCVKWTTVIPHAIVGTIFMGTMLAHMGKRLKKVKYCNKNKKVVDYILTVDCVLLLLTGLMAHPMHDVIWIKILHAVTAVLFVIFCIIHVVQHTKKMK